MHVVALFRMWNFVLNNIFILLLVSKEMVLLYVTIFSILFYPYDYHLYLTAKVGRVSFMKKKHLLTITCLNIYHDNMLKVKLLILSFTG
jgi:hypothetical protein